MRHKQGLQQKIPDVKRTIDVVKTLQKRSKSDIDEPITTRFELGDQIYVKAEIPKSDSVSLWLGVSKALQNFFFLIFS